MPASIVVTNLSWQSPDNKQLFSNLSFAATAQRIGIVGRNGVGKSTLLHLIAHNLAPQSGSISTPPNLRLLEQSHNYAPTATLADLFTLGFDFALLAKADAGTATTEELALIDWSAPFAAQSALADFHLDHALDTPLSALSGGQLTRAQMASAFSSNADFLLLDEPTNNLDQHGRSALFNAIAKWKNGLLIVSHDEELLCHVDEIIELTSIGATRFGGNFALYQAQKSEQLALAQNQLTRAQKNLRTQSATSQRIIESKARKDAAGRKSRSKNDAPKILLDAKQDRAEATSGANANIAAKAKLSAETALNSAQNNLEILEPLTITLPEVSVSPSACLLSLRNFTFSYPDRPTLFTGLSVDLIGPTRARITGSNGSGKSTLIKLITGQLTPSSGTLSLTPHFALLDQALTLLNPSQTIEQNFMRLNPQQTITTARTLLARFLFRNLAALKNIENLSGGEKMRAALACVFGGVETPKLLILDEPTNHLDYEAKAELISALNFYTGALLIVSHDKSFITALNPNQEISLDTPNVIEA